MEHRCNFDSTRMEDSYTMAVGSFVTCSCVIFNHATADTKPLLLCQDLTSFQAYNKVANDPCNNFKTRNVLCASTYTAFKPS